MKIQKITQVPLKFGQKQISNNKNNDSNINEKSSDISIYNKAGVRLPYFIFHNRAVVPSDIANDIVTELRSAVFRDNELFDENRDSDDYGYRMYDKDDISPVSQSRMQVDEDYYLLKGSKYNVNKEFETNIAFPNNDKLLEDDITKISKNREISGNNVLNELSYLKKGFRNIYSIELNDALIEKRSYLYSIDTIKTVTKAATLVNAFECEHIDYDLFETGFKLADSYAVDNAEDAAKLMRASVLKDEENNEYYSKDMMSLLKNVVKHLSADVTIDICCSAVKYKKGEGQYCSPVMVKKISKQIADLFGNDK